MIAAESIAAARDRAIADVAVALGAAAAVRRAEHGVPCPACGGTDRFAVDPAKNLFLCRASGAGGDPIDLVRHVHGLSFAEAVELLTGDKALPAGPKQGGGEDDNAYRRKAQERGYRIWRAGHEIAERCGGRLVRAYLELRGIPFPDWTVKALRETDRLDYWHWHAARREFVKIHSGPAMLAAITGPDGRFIGVHRTWLDLSRPDGKAAIADPETGEVLAVKKVEGSQRGGKIELRRGEPGGACVIGEGIETTLAWNAMPAPTEFSVFNGSLYPCATLWAGINLDNMAGKAKVSIPHPSRTVTDTLGRRRAARVPGTDPDPADLGCMRIPFGLFDRAVLLGDGDSDRFATQAAMIRAERRLKAGGLDAVTDWAPDGQDWNDALKGIRTASRRAPAAIAACGDARPDPRPEVRP